MQIRPQICNVAALVRVTGRIGPASRDLVLTNPRRFTLVQGPLVLDPLDGHGFDGWLRDAINLLSGNPTP